MKKRGNKSFVKYRKPGGAIPASCLGHPLIQHSSVKNDRSQSNGRSDRKLTARIWPTAADISNNYTAKDHLAVIIPMLRERAHKLGWMNLALLVGIFGIVAACLLLFWFSDALTTDYIGSALRAKLDERSKLRQGMQLDEEKIGKVNQRVVLAEQASLGIQGFVDLADGLHKMLQDYGGLTAAAVTDQQKLNLAIRAKRLRGANGEIINESRKVFKAIATGLRNDADIEVLYHGQHLFSFAMLLEIKRLLATVPLSADEVVSVIDMVENNLSVVADSNATTERVLAAHGNLVAIDNQWVSQVENLKERAKREIQNAEQASKSINAGPTASNLAEKRRDLDKLNEEIDALQQQQNNTMYLAWVPSFSVRVGSVLMALFLTQFLVSIYRYNTIVQRFYHSRADVLQLLAPKEGMRWLDVEDIRTCVAGFASDAIDFVAPTPPYEALKGMLERQLK